MKHNSQECINCGHQVHPGSTLCRDCIITCGGRKYLKEKEGNMIKTAPRIADQTGDFLPKRFASVNAGAEYVLDSFPALYQRTLMELKGKFNHNELSLITDVFNSTMLTARIAGQHLALQVADGCDLDRLDEKWKIDKDMLLEKINGLNIFQAACLEIWANGFWYAKDSGPDESRDLEAYIKTLL